MDRRKKKKLDERAQSQVVVDFAMPKDAVSQFAEGLYNLQTEIDSLKNEKALTCGVDQNSLDSLTERINLMEKTILAETDYIINDVKELSQKVDDINNKIDNLGEEIAKKVIESLNENLTCNKTSNNFDVEFFETKFRSISIELASIKSKVDYQRNVESIADGEQLIVMLEQIKNQVNVLLESNRSDIDNIRSEVIRFTNNFTSIANGESSDENDLQERLNLLREELDNISKLMEDDTLEEDGPLSNSVEEISKGLGNITKEIIDEENKDNIVEEDFQEIEEEKDTLQEEVME